MITATILAATPLVLAALGGLCSERGGVVNIALEGLILVGAFAAAAVTLATGSPLLGLLAGVAAGALAGGLHGIVCIWLRADHVVSGIAVNLLAEAGTILLLKAIYGSKGGTPQLGDLAPGDLGPLPAVTWLALLAVPLTWWLVHRTRFGLRLRACGESPEAADAVGIPVHRYRLAGVVLSGALAGLAGVSLALTAGSFTRHMAAGRGYIALAALVFGRWRPMPVTLGCFLFALGRGLQTTLGIGHEIPPQLTAMLPYALTLAALSAGPLLRRRGAAAPGPPAALGRHFVKA